MMEQKLRTQNLSNIDSSDKPEESEQFIIEYKETLMPAGKGTGLELSISYSIIQQHQGTIEVESHADSGSIFTVRLPSML